MEKKIIPKTIFKTHKQTSNHQNSNLEILVTSTGCSFTLIKRMDELPLGGNIFV